MQTHFTDLDKINLDDLEKYLVRKGWELSNRYNQMIKEGRFYLKNKHELLLIDPSYYDYQHRLSEALSTLLCVEEIELPVKFQYNREMPLCQYYIGVISGEDIQKLLTN